MSTFAQTTTGDLQVTLGEFSLITDPATACAAKIRNQFRIFLGEWFLDTRIGMPYFQQVFVKNPNLGVLSQLFRGVILNTPGVSAVNSCTVNFNAATRVCSVNFAALFEDGTVITSAQLDQPFLVQIPQATVIPGGTS